MTKAPGENLPVVLQGLAKKIRYHQVLLQGRIQDFRFSGDEETKWRANRAAILATPIFRLKNGLFRHFQVYMHHTLNTVLKGSAEGVTVSTCIK